MNNLQRFSVIFVAVSLLCILFLNSSMAQPPSKSAESIKTQIILRSMTAKESQNFDNQLKKENQKKSSGQKVLDTLNSSGANASYGSADAMIDVAKENKAYLLKTTKKLIKKVVKKSSTIKSIVGKGGGGAKKALKGLGALDKTATGGSFFGSLVGGDIVGAFESLLNAAGSGYSAAAGGKAGAAIGTMIAPGPGTVIGGFIGAFAGALTYNEVAAPQVEKAGDYASNQIASGEAQIKNERRKIEREYKKNFDTVYPHGYMGSGRKDPLTGMIYELRPDILSQNAEKIRQANIKKFNEKVDQEILKNKKKMDWKSTPNKTKPGNQTTVKVKKVVPDVTNKSLENAFNILKNAGFILGSPEGGDPAPSKKLVRHVQMQLPAGGQPQYQNIPIVLTLYSDIEIPDVVGLKAAEALKKLKKAGFSMAPEGCDPPPTKDLSLLAKEQKPAAYTPGKGLDTVTVTFYPEYQNPVVPGITTLKLSKAQGVLEEMGLSLSSDLSWGEQAATKEQVGTIQKQLPTEGEPIEPGGEVKAWVYYTVVPKVLTMSKKDAESAMQAVWFVPNSVKGEAVKNKNKWGTIYSQSLQPEKKFAEANMKVTLRFYKKPEKKNIGHPIVTHWEGFNGKIKSKIKVIVYWDITSIGNNGKIKGTLTIPEQVIQLHNGRGDTMKKSKEQVPFHGSLKGNKITIFYEVPGAKTMAQGIWDAESMTMEGMNIVSTNYNRKWHENGVHFYLKRK